MDANGFANDADEELFLNVLGAYQEAEFATRERLERLGLDPTTRTKTTDVLIDKLRREHGTLKSVQDFAGARVVCSGGRDEQDRTVEAIVAEFADGAKAAKVRDRRVEPSHGYRAVHVIVTVDGLPVEVQVRTEMQDQWAQIVERLGDIWGRGIRYGEGPRAGDTPLSAGSAVSRNRVWEAILDLSEYIDAAEELGSAVARLRRAREVTGSLSVDDTGLVEIAGLEEVLLNAEKDVKEGLQRFSLMAAALEGPQG